MLRLNAADEIEAGLDKRDWGNWLHEVLLRFHEGRAPDPDPAADAAALQAAARVVPDEHGLDAADFLPWQASFDAFVPRYLAFMRRRDEAGARWQLGEQSFTLPLPEAAVELYGIVDRIDEVAGGDGAGPRADRLQGRQPQPLEGQSRLGFEDTQLAFYAALVGAASGLPVRAGYLPLESREALDVERHKEVEASGRALTEGVAIDITRLRGGAALRALGEGSVCEWCDVRGLCRRDDWQAEVQGPPTGRGAGDERRPGPAGRRRAGLAGSLLRHRLRPGEERAWSRPAPARARPGCWCRASSGCCSPASSRTTSSPSPSPAPRPARCATASPAGSPNGRCKPASRGASASSGCAASARTTRCGSSRRCARSTGGSSTAGGRSRC